MSFEPIPQPRRAPVAPWVCAGLTVTGLLLATSVLGTPAAPAVTGVDHWLPPDGTRVALTDGTQTRTAEWSQPNPHSMLQLNSPAFPTWINLTDTEWSQARYLRVAGQLLDSAAQASGKSEEIWLLTGEGASTITETVDDIATIWVPGRLDLPANLASGGQWQSEGEVGFQIAGGEWTSGTYRAEYQALAPADPALASRGCLVVTRQLTVLDQLVQSEHTWCPGAGMVSYQDDDRHWQPAAGLPRLALEPDPIFDWTRAAELEFGTSPHSQPDVLGSPFLSPVGAAGVLPGGQVTFANNLLPDLLAVDPTDPATLANWVARPGGQLTSSASFSGVTVVTTSRREVIGYGPHGQWLWQNTLSDLTRVPPVRFGDAVVVVTLDGGVTGYDLSTGAQRWRATTGMEIRIPPLAAGDHLLVADQGGALICLDVAGEEQWTIDAGQAARLALIEAPEPAVVVGRVDSYVLRAYALDDGSQLWRSRVLEDVGDLIALDGRLVLRDRDRLVGIDPASGAQLWSRPFRSLAGVGGAGHVLLLTEGHLTLVDADGMPVREWPHELGDIEQLSRFLTVAGDAVVAFGPDAFLVGRLR